MSLLYVRDVFNDFKNLTQEQDLTFLTTKLDIPSSLSVGYDMLREKVVEANPEVYAVEVDLPFVAGVYNLATGATKLLGSSATTRLRNIVSIHDVNSGLAGQPYVGVANETNLIGMRSQGYPGYFLKGNVLRLSTGADVTVRLTYIPHQTVDWTKTGSGDSEWIDDLIDYHDLITLFAIQRYAAMDWSQNGALQAVFAQRLAGLQNFLQGGRQPEASGDVVRYDSRGEY